MGPRNVRTRPASAWSNPKDRTGNTAAITASRRGTRSSFAATASIPRAGSQGSGSDLLARLEGERDAVDAYLNPPGGGPTGETWPRCPPQLLQCTSVRVMP